MKFNSKMLSVAAATALIVSMTGCGSTATSASKTGGTEQQITNPKGSVTGTVQDTNGNPIKGVKVYLAGQTTTTDAGGVYTFNNVPATQAFDIAVSAAEVGQQLSVTIAAPEGYVGATVTVRPAAQITTDSNTTNGVKTFIDGFIASAGTAVLPETNSTVVGVLRDADTEAPLANTTIKFEFLAGGTAANVAQEQKQNGVDTSYAVATYTLTTDANGSFSFASLPTDSTFQLLVPGYDNVDVGGATDQFSSDAETVVTLGNVVAKKITALDGQSPFVVSVNNIISAPTVARAVLDDDTRNTFVVNFSETLTPSKLELAGNSVYLYAGKDGEMTKREFTATINTADNAITFTIADTLADGDFVDLLFLNADTVDTSMNPLSLNANIGYDELKGNYTRVKLEIFSEENTNAAAATAQAQIDEDTHGVNDFEKLQTLSDAFKDVLDESGKIYQLNSSDDDDNNGIDSAQRLTALSTALGGGTVVADTARITFTAADANSYVISVTDKSGTTKSLPAITGKDDALTYDGVPASLGANDQDFDGTTQPLIITPDANVSVEIALFNVAPTDVVLITPTDSLGYPGTPKRVTLVDNVAPTTILQKSFLSGTPTVETGGTTAQFGDGGELSQNSDTTSIGAPYLSVNPGLLDDLDGNGENVNAGATRDHTLQEELMVNNTIDASTGTNWIPKNVGIYDASAYNKFTTRLNRTIGVAFSEDVNLTGTPATTGFSTTLSNAKVYNDVTSNVDGGTVNSDLITLDIEDVVVLANSDNGKIIDFANVIEDTAGNKATSATNAKVVVLDEMPPMVEKAYFNGTSYVIEFNENVTLKDGMTVSISDTTPTTKTATYSATAPVVTWSVAGNTLTIAKSAFDFKNTPFLNNSTNWNLATYAYDTDIYGVNALSDHKLAHLVLSTSDVPDTHGNTWNTYAANTTRDVATPAFAIVNKLTKVTPTFSTDNTNFKVADDTTSKQQTVVWTYDQPVRVSQSSDIFYLANLNTGAEETDGSRIIYDSATAPATNGEVSAYFEAVIAGAADVITNGDNTTNATRTEAKLSPDHKTITLKFTSTTDITSVTADGVRTKQPVFSDYDYAKSVSTVASPK